MRKLSILLGLFIALSVSAQDVNTLLRKGGSFKGLGRQVDTLVALGTVDYVIELDDEVYGVLALAVEADSISGTSAYSSYLYKSLNGVDWGVPLDTITHSGGGDDYATFDSVNGTSTFYKISTVSTAGVQKSLIKIWGRLNEGFVIEN